MSAIAGAPMIAVANGFSIRKVRDLNSVTDTCRTGLVSLSTARAPWACAFCTPANSKSPTVVANAKNAIPRRQGYAESREPSPAQPQNLINITNPSPIVTTKQPDVDLTF